MQKEDLILIQNHIDYVFKNTNLLVQAFTRSTYSMENGGADNEVLEFIGDKALDVVVVKYLSDRFGTTKEGGFTCEYDEGELTQMKARLVQKSMLAKRIDFLDFSKYLQMGKGDVNSQIETKSSVKEDLFEAIVGAVALDSNWDLSILEHVIINMLDPESELEEDGYENYIGLVQDWALEMYGELPLYHAVCYSQIHMHNGTRYVYGDNYYQYNGREPKYMCILKLPGYEQLFFEAGESEQEARYWAAKRAYRFITENGLEKKIQDEIENPNYEESINQLEILARRGYFSIPVYDFSEIHDSDGNPIWECSCTIAEISKTMHGKSSSKKDAKKQAAFKMLKHVLEEE